MAHAMTIELALASILQQGIEAGPLIPLAPLMLRREMLAV